MTNGIARKKAILKRKSENENKFDRADDYEDDKEEEREKEEKEEEKWLTFVCDVDSPKNHIQEYVSAVAVNYNQGNSGYRPPCVANQIRPLGFAQPNVKNNQNRFSQPQGYNRGNNFNQDSSYQALIHQNQVVPLSELEKIKKMNEINIFFQMNTASTSGSGPLPSNTIANPKGELKAITTRSGIVLDGPSVPMHPSFINPEEDERVEETLIDPKLALLYNKEKLLELENTPPNENCSTVILKMLPEKLRDPRKFLIPCGFSELKCKALADLGASINLMPLFVWKKLGLPELISTRMTLKLANRAICTPAGIARDVIVPVGKFTFPADFVIVDYKSDLRVPLILGRPFLQTARALIDTDLTSPEVKDDIFDLEGHIVLNSTKDLPPPHNINPLSGSTTYSSLDLLLEEFADELALITFPLGNDELSFDIKSDLREIEYFLNHDPIKEMDSILDDSIDESNLANPNDFSEVDALPSTDNEDKVFNMGILIQENLFEINTHVAPDKIVKKKSISHASLILEDFDPPLYELPFHKEVPGSETLLSFSSKNEEKVFKPGILTYKGVHSSLLLELSHRGHKVFKVIKILKSPMEIFPCFYGEDIRILDVLCLHFYPPQTNQFGGWVKLSDLRQALCGWQPMLILIYL
uniref:Reverse transcriptase domain-containing protein n=1 Tax=Tanacetum cinerariifolium TaxID=118510 RepID=A0A6L2K4F8_TANCI|nr:reverse transcriptase domain-containing protein [Tanacetum cinerariifolium]